MIKIKQYNRQFNSQYYAITGKHLLEEHNNIIFINQDNIISVKLKTLPSNWGLSEKVITCITMKDKSVIYTEESPVALLS